MRLSFIRLSFRKCCGHKKPASLGFVERVTVMFVHFLNHDHAQSKLPGKSDDAKRGNSICTNSMNDFNSVVSITIQSSEWIGMIFTFLTLAFHQSSQHKKIRFTNTGFVWLNIWASINPEMLTSRKTRGTERWQSKRGWRFSLSNDRFVTSLTRGKNRW